MRMLEIKVMRGPNYWSNYRKNLIVIKLDLEELEREPTHKIHGFADRIKKLLPTLSEHHCSEGHRGGFFERVEQGTWMGHVIEHIALEIQSLAGMFVGYGRTRSTHEQGVYYVVFAYRVEEAGRYAAKAAIRIADALVKNIEYDISEDINYLKRLYRRQKFGPSTESIVEEAKLRNIPYKRLNRNSLIILGHGHKLQKIRATIADTTAGIGIEIAKDKDETKNLLQSGHLPTPKGVLVYDEEDVRDLIDDVRFPMVMKPYNGNHGRGISTNITTLDQALQAFRLAAEVSTPVIMEEFVEGDDFRLVLVNYKLIAAAKRTPAMVTGDGRSTIAELIEQVNKDPLRGEGHEEVLTSIEVDEITMGILEKKGLHISAVLPEGEKLYLKHTANISSGGTSEDVTDNIHPYNVFLAERVARMLNLNICGIDIVARDLSKPLTMENGGIVEVNAGPGLRMHHHPSKGLARNIAKPIIEMLFPDKDDGRIPLVAITGTNGKTTTTRLVAHLAQHAGHKVGFTTTDGIYIQGHQIFQGDCTGPVSAETVLYDPTINFAVLECARGGILRAGLAFDTSDISIVTNITADHLGLKDIDSLEEMAKVKIVVPRTTKDEGYAILNADDELVYAMRDELDCKIALFSMSGDNPHVKEHCEKGGLAAMLENGYITVCQGQWKTRIERIDVIPITLGGRSESMIKNLLPMALVGMIRNLRPDMIRAAMNSFIPTPESAPGRMNLFKFRSFDLLLDYAHNMDGFTELKKFLSKTKASEKIGVVGLTGDRRDQDLRDIGRICAEIFDRIILRHDADLRGRTKEELDELFLQGVEEVDKEMKVKIISEENQAIAHALEIAKENSFVVVCADNVSGSIEFIRNAQGQEDAENQNAKHPG